MDRFNLTQSRTPQFSADEIIELGRLCHEMGERSVDQNFCREIAKSFSSSSNRAGKASLTWKQVQNWFRNKLKESPAEVAPSPESPDLFVDLSVPPLLEYRPNSSSSLKGKEVVIREVKQDANISDLSFEARSTKDLAWHDVASFLNYRVMSTGELEVRVRYAGFGKEQDEWINVKEGLRERSIPLDPSECHKVNSGDLVLCFLKRPDFALYCDAHVVKVVRMPHGPAECNCIFIVQYAHDKTEEGVSWIDLCCRPSQEEHVRTEEHVTSELLALPLNPIEDLWG